jgi:hypothetical protein
MKPDTKTNTTNQLLNALAPAAFERVAKKLTRVKLRQKEVVYKPNQPIDHVLFPEDAILCLMTLMPQRSVEKVRHGSRQVSPHQPCRVDLDRERKENSVA